MTNGDNYDDFVADQMRPRYIRCVVQTCGADDCPNCRPGNFQDGVLVDNMLKEQVERSEP